MSKVRDLVEERKKEEARSNATNRIPQIVADYIFKVEDPTLPANQRQNAYLVLQEIQKHVKHAIDNHQKGIFDVHQGRIDRTDRSRTNT